MRQSLKNVINENWKRKAMPIRVTYSNINIPCDICKTNIALAEEKRDGQIKYNCHVYKVTHENKRYNVCKKCYGRHQKHGDFESHKKPGLSPEERKLRGRERARIFQAEKKVIRNNKNKVLLKMKPDDLLKFIGYYDEESK
jgi:hypothetical protein